MTYNVKCLQARCAALGFDPGPIDGLMGPKTRLAEEQARSSQFQKGLPFIHPSGVTRLHLHWTGGPYTITSADRKAYHEVITGSGDLVKLAPLAERRSHTLNANGQAGSLSLCAMGGPDVRERPLVWGSYPITEAQMLRLYRRAFEISQLYDIPVSPYSILTHAEIEPTLGIKQNQKWDITCLPGMTSIGGARAVGDLIRKGILEKGRG